MARCKAKKNLHDGTQAQCEHDTSIHKLPPEEGGDHRHYAVLTAPEELEPGVPNPHAGVRYDTWWHVEKDSA